MIKYEIDRSHKSLIINNPTEFCANSLVQSEFLRKAYVR